MKRVKLISTRPINSKLKKFKAECSYYDQSMEDYVSVDYDLAEERANHYDKALIELEQRLDFSQWVPERFGTRDVVILADNIIEIIYLEYARGAPVEVCWIE
ncbi:DUF2800 domain-containing protein [Enterococcus hulanensis]|uniref:DUF2800 domain-containing protein n=1 Tax=Enterococcus hulanensis TaxID=2559929 RepID=UPI0028936F61|nr:DUF2800 domain-containing protein [Enterococcus hulanensis]